MNSPNLKKLIQLALEEDMGRGDLSALAVPKGAQASARLIAKQSCVATCLFLAPLLLSEAGVNISWEQKVQDGDSLKDQSLIGILRGNAREILGVERTLLNFWQRLFGIATQANQLAQMKLPVRILDTRKTTPGMRVLEKKAVRDGGLYNHRFALDSGVLLKENHIRAAGGITAALRAIHNELPQLISTEVEVTSEAEAFEAIGAGARILLLDNFTPDDLFKLVPKLRAIGKELFLEASGGIRPSTIQQYAATGVDAVSVGFLTHSVPSADLSLLFELQ